MCAFINGGSAVVPSAFACNDCRACYTPVKPVKRSTPPPARRARPPSQSCFRGRVSVWRIIATTASGVSGVESLLLEPSSYLSLCASGNVSLAEPHLNHAVLWLAPPGTHTVLPNAVGIFPLLPGATGSQLPYSYRLPLVLRMHMFSANTSASAAPHGACPSERAHTGK